MSAADVSALITGVTVGNALTALLVYDWLLCFDAEVSLVWAGHHKRTWASLVYAFSRYLPLVQYILQIATIFPMSTSTHSCSCDSLPRVLNAINLLSVLTPCLFSTMRVYALSGMNVVLSLVTFTLSFIPIVLDLIENVKWFRIQNLPQPFNCSPGDVTPQGLLLIVIVADSIVLGTTWWYTYQSYRAQRGIHIRSSLTSAMLYNGSIYFLVLASLNALDLALVTLGLAQNSFLFRNVSYVGLFADVLTAILISRFILNLRQVNYDAAHPSDASVSLGVLFTQSRPGPSLPRSLLSFAEPVHVGHRGPDMASDLHPPSVLGGDGDAVPDSERQIDDEETIASTAVW
ncbi:hypothetical protein DICSQDRAFT_174213 [Dichomitus squalens LYAD-421 SS1]|uniref:DUF6533 domain-containing protein n=1 Tax=Dichomitus squalens (strain LYAD-421) TaxID=732165 RepID=R7SN85_DICSQ|nr:uncharacterized protein DICSQDRAFT_174213 [Dichomitus squalens LYAD-421 SS1]EJF57155.1 hypothetical protein DICSQDRAFT_174213 [Dichomitus squalens LYAD-421 SS1]